MVLKSFETTSCKVIDFNVIKRSTLKTYHSTAVCFKLFKTKKCPFSWATVLNKYPLSSSFRNFLFQVSISSLQYFYLKKYLFYQEFEWLSHKNLPIPQTEGYFKNLSYFFSEEPMLFLLGLKWHLLEKAFCCVKTKSKSNSAVNPVEMLKEATINFCLFDESHFPNICTLEYVIMVCIEINFLRKRRKKNRSRQASISINSSVELSKIQFALWVSSTLIRLFEGSFFFFWSIWPPPSLCISRRIYLISI